MKEVLLLVTLLMVQSIVRSQYKVSGTVVNSANGLPLAGASVFINNASKGTSSDKDGSFILENITIPNFELVISFVSFQTIVTNITPENIHKLFRIEMAAKQELMQEVILSPVDKNGWQNWGKLFTEHFIGKSKNATQCRIENPGVLRFRYNRSTQVLRVSSVDKLIIRNKALGLTVDYQLEEFSYNGRQHMISYLGYSSFEKMKSNSRRIQQRWIDKRQEAYNGSMMHFMRSFNADNLDGEGFQLRQLIRLYKQDTVTRFVYDRILQGDVSVYDTSLFVSQVMSGDGARSRNPIVYIYGRRPLSIDSVRLKDSRGTKTYLSFRNDLDVVYKNEPEKMEYVLQQNVQRKQRNFQESILFLTSERPILVEANGLFFNPLDMFAEGYWASEKIAEMLPSDYEPGE